MALPIFDLHQDLFSHTEVINRYGGEYQTSYSALRDSEVKLVIASTFNMNPDQMVFSEENADYSLRVIDAYRRRSIQPDIDLILGPEDLCGPDNRLGLLIHIEGVQPFAGPIEEALAEWWKLGVRSIGPMWNLRNGIGGGPDHPDTALTKIGRRLVRWVDANRMVLDLSHMGEATLWDTMAQTNQRVIASHANARSLADHPRNLHDDQLKALAERGGVIGLVFSQRFLGLSRDLEAVIAHADYIANLVGIEHLALGSDLGGLDDLIPEVPNVAGLEVLSERLIEEFGAVGAEMITWGNAVRGVESSLSKSP